MSQNTTIVAVNKLKTSDLTDMSGMVTSNLEHTEQNKWVKCKYADTETTILTEVFLKISSTLA
jgi:hypothetical protein